MTIPFMSTINQSNHVTGAHASSEHDSAPVSDARPAWTEPTVEEVPVAVTEAAFRFGGADGGIYS